MFIQVTATACSSLQANSIFHMKRPFDLVSFMAQEARAERLEALRPAEDELSWTAASSTSTTGSRAHANAAAAAGSKEDRMTAVMPLTRDLSDMYVGCLLSRLG